MNEEEEGEEEGKEDSSTLSCKIHSKYREF